VRSAGRETLKLGVDAAFQAVLVERFGQRDLLRLASALEDQVEPEVLRIEKSDRQRLQAVTLLQRLRKLPAIRVRINDCRLQLAARLGLIVLDQLLKAGFQRRQRLSCWLRPRAPDSAWGR
jgi:hypothetical protein